MAGGSRGSPTSAVRRSAGRPLAENSTGDPAASTDRPGLGQGERAARLSRVSSRKALSASSARPPATRRRPRRRHPSGCRDRASAGRVRAGSPTWVGDRPAAGVAHPVEVSAARAAWSTVAVVNTPRASTVSRAGAPPCWGGTRTTVSPGHPPPGSWAARRPCAASGPPAFSPPPRDAAHHRAARSPTALGAVVTRRPDAGGAGLDLRHPGDPGEPRRRPPPPRRAPAGARGSATSGCGWSRRTTGSSRAPARRARGARPRAGRAAPRPRPPRWAAPRCRCAGRCGTCGTRARSRGRPGTPRCGRRPAARWRGGPAPPTPWSPRRAGSWGTTPTHRRGPAPRGRRPPSRRGRELAPARHPGGLRSAPHRRGRGRRTRSPTTSTARPPTQKSHHPPPPSASSVEALDRGGGERARVLRRGGHAGTGSVGFGYATSSDPELDCGGPKPPWRSR